MDARARAIPPGPGDSWLNQMLPVPVDTASRTPLHRQVSDFLRARITDGTLPPGSLLPTEAELQTHFGISRSVVRQALLTLSIEGLVLRGKGRGSVVAPRGEYHRLVQRMSGLSIQAAAAGADVTTEILSLGRERNVSTEMTLGSRDSLAIRRLRSVEAEPIALIHTWLPLWLSDKLTADELTNASLHTVMSQKFGLTLVSGTRQVRAVAATVYLAEQLRVDVGSPLLLLEGTSFDEFGRPAEVFCTWHRSDRVVFDLDVIESDLA